MKNKEFGIENLRETVLLSDSKVWGIVSRKKGAGKTYIAKKLVEYLEKAGKKVLLLGFQGAEKESVSLEKEIERISHGAEESRKSDNKKVFLTNCTQIDRVAYDENFEALIDLYKKDYDYIVMDIISLEESSVAKKLCSMCENNMFIISKNLENGPELHKAIQQLQDAGISISGIVINEYQKKRSFLRM